MKIASYRRWIPQNIPTRGDFFHEKKTEKGIGRIERNNQPYVQERGHGPLRGLLRNKKYDF